MITISECECTKGSGCQYQSALDAAWRLPEHERDRAVAEVDSSFGFLGCRQRLGKPLKRGPVYPEVPPDKTADDLWFLKR